MPNVNVVRLAQYDGNQGLTARQAIVTSNSRRVTLLPNKSTTGDATHGFDGRLVLTGAWKNEKPVYPAWTGTLFAHGKKDSPLPKMIEYTDSQTKEKWVFDTGAAAAARGVILAVNHGFTQDGKPLIQLHEDKNRIVVEITDPKQISIIENFPAKDGWYLAGNDFGIPTGDKVNSSNPDARYLYRIGDEKAGLLVRGYCLGDYDEWRYVVAGFRPSYRAGVLALENVAQQKTEAAAKPDVKQLEIDVEKILQKPVKERTEQDWATVEQFARAVKSR